jgi:hypothetical protein
MQATEVREFASAAGPGPGPSPSPAEPCPSLEVQAVGDVMQATPAVPRRSKCHPMRIASTCALWPGSGVLVAALAAAGLAGCTASAEDVRAPQDQLFFPTGLAVSQDESVLFVANANSELRYDSGSIGVIDLGVVQTVLGGWLGGQTIPSDPFDCARDPDHIETLVCDEAQFFRKGAGVRIGNFATDLAIQSFTDGSGLTRVFVPTRGDPSISWANFLNGSLRCTVNTETYALCDDTHRLTSVADDPDETPVPGEPFGVFADARNGFAMVTHLTNGSVTLVRAPVDDSKVAVIDVQPNVFAQDLTTGLRGASGIAGRHSEAPGDIGDLVYVGGTTEDRIQTYTVGTRDNAASFLLPGSHFFLDAVGNNAGGSSDTRGMEFSPTGDRLYISNRNPPSLQVYDTSLGPSGVPRNVATGSSDICREASALAVLDSGAGERAYVTCFQDGQIYVVDPSDQSQVEDIITVGRGPYSAAPLAGKSAPGRKLLFVSNFLEDTISVIDLNLDSVTRNRVVLRIGKPRVP